MKEIDSFIHSEFNIIKNELNIHFEGSFDINQKKQFLATYVSKEIVFRSGALLDTHINLMMNEAIERLDNYGINIQNKFFEADFKAKIKNHINDRNLPHFLEAEEVSFSQDPRYINGIIAGGSSLVIGSIVTGVLFKTSRSAVAITAGLTTLVLSILAYKITYGKFTEQARNIMQRDVNTFLTTSEQQVKEWLYNIKEIFESEFNQFLNQHQHQLQ